MNTNKLETFSIILCPSCNEKIIYEEDPTSNYDKHLLSNPNCVKWAEYMTNPEAKTIDRIVTLLQNKSIESICKTCNNSYSNIGNYNKHIKNNPICLKLEIYNTTKNNPLKNIITDHLKKNNINEMEDIGVYNLSSPTQAICVPGNYYKGWPSQNCPYIKDLEWAKEYAIKYLKSCPVYYREQERGAIVLDLDDTIVFGDPENYVGIREYVMGENENGQEIYILPTNQPIVDIMNYAKSIGFTIIVATARPEKSRAASIKNLELFGIPYDHLFFVNETPGISAELNKYRTLQKIKQKHEIILYVGDQLQDACYYPCSIKLPDPTLKRSLVALL
jgi:hypothetical protein